jgi:hypothetical protein
MPSLRFAHCAGFLFDSPNWEGPSSWTAMRTQDLWFIWENVLTLCRTENIDFLFIVGNLFEQEYTRKKTVERVAGSLGNLYKTKVFITPGAKDPLVTTSVYRLSEWPPNVHIFPGGRSKVEIPSSNAVIYGLGWVTYRQQTNPLMGFSSLKNKEEIKFMLLPAQVEGYTDQTGDNEQNTSFFLSSITEEQIEATGLTYLALGQNRKGTGLQVAGDTYWADCGSAVLRSFQESFIPGLLLGETDGQTTTVEFRELKQRRYVDIHFQKAEVQEFVAGLVAKTTDEERQNNLFRFRLLEPFSESEAYDLYNQLQDKFKFIQILTSENQEIPLPGWTEEKTPQSEREELGFPNLTQIFREDIEEKLVSNSSQRSFWELVRRIGLSALDQGWEDGIEDPQVLFQDLKLTEIKENETKDSEPLPLIEKGSLVIWPEKEDLSRLISNLKETGNQNLSLAKIWDSLARAKNRLEEQTEKIEKLRNEYEVLREAWEEERIHREQERALEVEIKNLQAEKDLYLKKLETQTAIQERLALYRQNPDYRELRDLEGKLAGLDENQQKIKKRLISYTQDPQIDWETIERLREDCIQGANLLKEHEQYAAKIENLEREIRKLEKFIHSSGYSNFLKDQALQLRQAEEEKNTAQAELDKLEDLYLTKLTVEKNLKEEITKLDQQEKSLNISWADERKINRIACRLEKWQARKIVSNIDNFLSQKLGLPSVREIMLASLNNTLTKYQFLDYQDYLQRKKELLEQQNNIEKIQAELELLKEQTCRAKKLRQIIQTRKKILEEAFQRVNVKDLESWLKGWTDYQQTKDRLLKAKDELQEMRAEQGVKEEELAAHVQQLRNKLTTWSSPVTDLDEVLDLVLKVARELHSQEEIEKERQDLEFKLKEQLGNRDLKKLSLQLEPLADLEREVLLGEKRDQEIASCRQKLIDLQRQLTEAKKSLRKHRTRASKPDLEKDMETAFQNWKAYEDLSKALTVTEDLLKSSLHRWQREYGIVLKKKALDIYQKVFASNNGELESYYFSYLMATKQVFAENSESPLVFLVKETKDYDFWSLSIAYLAEISKSRPIYIGTFDNELRALLALIVEKKQNNA